MGTGLAEIWVYLAREPLAALTVTLLAWLAAQRLHRTLGRAPRRTASARPGRSR